MKAFSPAINAEPARPSDSSLLWRALEVVRPDSVSRFAIILLLYIGASWGGNALTRTPAVADLIWPANGLLLAFLLRTARRYWSVYLTSSILVNIVVHMAFGFSPGRAILYTMANTVEVIIAASLLSTKDNRKPDLTNLRTLARFLLFGVLLAPLASTGFMEMVLAVWTYPRHPELLANWFTGDVMGMALMAPLFMAIDKTELEALFVRGNYGRPLVFLPRLRLFPSLSLHRPACRSISLLSPCFWWQSFGCAPRGRPSASCLWLLQRFT